MNQKQREFLIDQVRTNVKKELEKLKRPQKPSLSNHIIAAALDGTLVLHTNEEIKGSIRERIMKMKENDNSIFGGGSRSYRDNDDDDEDKNSIFAIKAKHIFIFPPAYLVELEEYEKAYAEYIRKKEELESLKDTLLLKIQIGSDKILDKLIEEADDLGDLSLMSSRLIAGKALPATAETKLIEGEK